MQRKARQIRDCSPPPAPAGRAVAGDAEGARPASAAPRAARSCVDASTNFHNGVARPSVDATVDLARARGGDVRAGWSARHRLPAASELSGVAPGVAASAHRARPAASASPRAAAVAPPRGRRREQLFPRAFDDATSARVCRDRARRATSRPRRATNDVPRGHEDRRDRRPDQLARAVVCRRRDVGNRTGSSKCAQSAPAPPETAGRLTRRDAPEGVPLEIALGVHQQVGGARRAPGRARR